MQIRFFMTLLWACTKKCPFKRLIFAIQLWIYSTYIRVGPRKVNLIVAICWSRPMWDMVIECLPDTFWPDPSKDLRSPRLPLPGGGCYDLGTPRMVHFDRDSKSMWKSYILSKFWLHNELDILAKNRRTLQVSLLHNKCKAKRTMKIDVLFM